MTVDNVEVQSTLDWFKRDWMALSLGDPISENSLKAPRRKAKDPSEAALAQAVAGLLYPSEPDSLSVLIKYEKDLVTLRKQVRLQRQQQADEKVISAVERQGPWDERDDPVTFPPAIPMPVEISSPESLEEFFTYLGRNAPFQGLEERPYQPEPYYEVPFLEFEKGALYEDGRMDLCKKVLGPPNIGPLMNALSANSHVKHFLLGNNIIGPTGCNRMAEFIQKYPDRMQTWYLAGNCIDRDGLDKLVEALIKSEIVRSLWLKRNPLTAASGKILRRLIVNTKNLATLDLDQTELSNEGVTAMLSDIPADISLRHLYMNGNGISCPGCAAISTFLSAAECPLESLFLSLNPLGNNGCAVLAPGLSANRALKRLMLSSCGISSSGAIQILKALKEHPTLEALSLGQGYATEDLGQRYNWLDDDVVDACEEFLKTSKNLRYFNLGKTAMSQTTLTRLAAAAADSKTLCFYEATSIRKSQQPSLSTRTLLANNLKQNVERLYDGMDYDTFLDSELRYVRNTREVRYIDSIYRNRDAQKARRGEMVLEKWWKDGADAEVLRQVREEILVE